VTFSRLSVLAIGRKSGLATASMIGRLALLDLAGSSHRNGVAARAALSG